jgi:hypothetical protein
MHQPPEEGSSRMSMATLSSQQESYNMHLESFDKGDRMAKCYSLSWCTFKLTKKQCLHLLDQTIVNTWSLLSPCGVKTFCRNFDLHLVRGHIHGDEKKTRKKTGNLHLLTKGSPSYAGNNID